MTQKYRKRQLLTVRLESKLLCCFGPLCCSSYNVIEVGLKYYEGRKIKSGLKYYEGRKIKRGSGYIAGEKDSKK